jgi:hypothetical protein
VERIYLLADASAAEVAAAQQIIVAPGHAEIHDTKESARHSRAAVPTDGVHLGTFGTRWYPGS